MHARAFARALAAMLVAFALIASTASARSGTFSCSQLQTALNQARTGDTIMLDQTCTGRTFQLGTGSHQYSYTLMGAPGTSAGFAGAGAATSLLHASGATSLATFTIRNLTFRNASAGTSQGGAA